MGPGMKKSLITNWTLALIEESAKTTLQEEVYNPSHLRFPACRDSITLCYQTAADQCYAVGGDFTWGD